MTDDPYAGLPLPAALRKLRDALFGGGHAAHLLTRAADALDRQATQAPAPWQAPPRWDYPPPEGVSSIDGEVAEVVKRAGAGFAAGADEIVLVAGGREVGRIRRPVPVQVGTMRGRVAGYLTGAEWRQEMMGEFPEPTAEERERDWRRRRDKDGR